MDKVITPHWGSGEPPQATTQSLVFSAALDCISKARLILSDHNTNSKKIPTKHRAERDIVTASVKNARTLLKKNINSRLKKHKQTSDTEDTKHSFIKNQNSTISLASTLYKKYAAGKNVFNGDFTPADWCDLGLSAASASAEGPAFSELADLLTSQINMPAPLAGAAASAAQGVASLLKDYSNGNINLYEFIDLGMLICVEAAIPAVVTMIGQTLIPAPVLGASLGQMAGKMLKDLAKGREKEISQRLRENLDQHRKNLSDDLEKTFHIMLMKFDRIDSITAISFDVRQNTDFLNRSVLLAKRHGVSSNRILTDLDTLDAFMSS